MSREEKQVCPGIVMLQSSALDRDTDVVQHGSYYDVINKQDEKLTRDPPQKSFHATPLVICIYQGVLALYSKVNVFSQDIPSLYLVITNIQNLFPTVSNW